MSDCGGEGGARVLAEVAERAIRLRPRPNAAPRASAHHRLEGIPPLSAAARMRPQLVHRDAERALASVGGEPDVDEGQGDGAEATTEPTARIASLLTAASSSTGPPSRPGRRDRGFRGAVLRATGVGMGNDVGSEEVMALRQEVSDLKGDIAELKTMMTVLVGRM